MTIRSRVSAAACALAILCAAGPALSQAPPPVPRLAEQSLDPASYVELARQWKEYIEENGETPDALVNLGMAYDYSEEHDAAVVAARRAVELGPDDPKALAFLGKMLATYVGDRAAALEVLEHCREVAPGYGYGLTMLATTHLFRGELSEADGVFKTIFDQRIISRPLQDYAYNMLVGLPQGAVLITSGDNDTFPPLALQAGMDFRTDVVVLNRSLLNVPEYAKAEFERHPEIAPDYDIDAHEVKTVDGVPTLLSKALVRAMVEEHMAPIYLSASAGGDYHGYKPEVHVEGVDLRTAEKGLSAEESARLFLETYRLDSATDWSVPWSLAPNEARLLANYVAAMIRLAEEKGVGKETRRRLLDEASRIAAFHHMDRMSLTIEKMQKE
jgi:hypothetical protein